MKYYYDLHIHSALSPCAEDDMTPCNIVNLAVINGLDIIAVTDHNAAGNLDAINTCAKNKNIVFIPGIEVESVEEVHIICLFSTVSSALEMETFIRKHLPKVNNREEIFGPQYILSNLDVLIGRESQMLLLSTDLSVKEILETVDALGGCGYFAHADRPSYSVFSNLGAIPQDVKMTAIEVTCDADQQKFLHRRPELQQCHIIHSSDSHRLSQMNHRKYYLDIDIEKERLTPSDVINYLKGV